MKGEIKPQSYKEAIANNLRKYRLQAGLSQVALAEKLGVRSSAISNWEKAVNSIDIDTLFKVCKILNVSVDKMADADISTNTKPIPDFVVEGINGDRISIEINSDGKHDYADLKSLVEWYLSRINNAKAPKVI